MSEGQDESTAKPMTHVYGVSCPSCHGMPRRGFPLVGIAESGAEKMLSVRCGECGNEFELKVSET